MDFIQLYTLAHSGTSVPERFIRWSALNVLALTLGRKVFVDYKRFAFYPAFYTCFVGPSAMRKSTPMDDMKRMFKSVFPEHPFLGDIASREMIIKLMSNEKFLKTYVDHNGKRVPYTPLGIVAHELSNFMSFNPLSMVEFLTNIFDRPDYKSATIARNDEYIEAPFLTLHAATTPKYIVEKFKHQILSGGFGRRMIFVYEEIIPKRVTFPEVSKEAEAAYKACQTHLMKIANLAGQMVWTDGAREFVDKWYQSLPYDPESIWTGYNESKDILAHKIAMLIIAAQPEPKLIFTEENMRMAVAFLESNEDSMKKLTIASGRNPLALYQHQMQENVEKNGGLMFESTLRGRMSDEIQDMEYQSIKRVLIGTKKLFEAKTKEDTLIFNAEGKVKLVFQGILTCEKCGKKEEKHVCEKGKL